MPGHVLNVPTHFNVKLPVIGGHLPNADSHLLVVRTYYNGQCKQQCKQMLRFWCSFQPKIAGANPNLRATVHSNFHAAIWCKQYFISRVDACIDEARDCGKSVRVPPLVTFVLRHHVVKVMSSVLRPQCRRREHCTNCYFYANSNYIFILYIYFILCKLVKRN